MNPLRALPLEELRAVTQARIADFPWKDSASLGGTDWRWGVPPEWLAQFCSDWADRYDWERIAVLFDSFSFVHGGDTGLTGLNFAGKASSPLIVLLHGWPSTVLEFVKVAASLHSKGHSVLVPALPGYPLSGRCVEPLGSRQAAIEILKLISAAGHRSFIAHGGDWGAEMAVWMGLLAPGECRGVHLAMRGMAGNEPMEKLRTPEERAWKERSDACYRAGGAYMEIQSREPLMVGYALAGSPVAMAAWICDKFLRWADGRGKGPAGAEAVIGRDFLLDTVTLYALTGRAASSLWMYPGYTAEEQIMPHRLSVPTAIFALPNDPVFPWPPHSLLERHYHVVQRTDPPHGAHFAALEVPDVLEGDLLSFLARTA